MKKKWIRIIGVGALSLLVCIPSGWAYTAKGVGVVTALKGQATVQHEAAPAPQPLQYRDDLFWRDVVDTQKDALARILLQGRSSITVRELSRLELKEETTSTGKKSSILLISGKIRATVEKGLMRSGDEIELKTLNAVTAVRGSDAVVEVIDGITSASQTFIYNIGHKGSVFDTVNLNSSTQTIVTLNPMEGAVISGMSDPVKFPITEIQKLVIVKGLTLPADRLHRKEPVTAQSKTQALTTATSEATRAAAQSNLQSVAGSSTASASTSQMAAQAADVRPVELPGGKPLSPVLLLPRPPLP
jgi:hypothetical protein